MAARPSLVVLLLGALASLGAAYRTPNFVIEAPTYPIAQQVGQYAEYYRREKALQWLGQEMPPWPEPCPVRVTVQARGSSGATSFAFDRGRILGMDMHIEGPLDRLLASVLPHEVTHTVFAHYFRCPLPRWADEGGSVLSEDDIERNNHEQEVRRILNTPGRAIPLRRLFTLMKYPPDVMVLYAEGYSVTEFLVGRSNRQTFLQFVAQGLHGDWDGAARAYYRFNTVEELEYAWVQHLREKRQAPPPQQTAAASPAEAGPAGRVVVRQTAPPAQPILQEPQPLVRGQMPEPAPAAAPGAGPGRPVFLPEYPTQPVQAQPTGFAPAAGPAAVLGRPQLEGAPVTTLGAPILPPGPP
jgi:hypothetical protein